MSREGGYIGPEDDTAASTHGIDEFKEVIDNEYKWLRDNEYLYRGYRTKMSFWEAFLTLFRSHNETINVWTHIIGVLMFVVLIYVTFAIPVEGEHSLRDSILHSVVVTSCSSKDSIDGVGSTSLLNATCSEVSPLLDINTLYSYFSTLSVDDFSKETVAQPNMPRWPIVVFILCAIWCMGGSATFHHYMCIDSRIKDVLQVIDYCGICILISGSYVSVIYYSFYCYPLILKVHLATVIIINVLNLCVMATPKFRSPSYRPVRATCFTVVACYAFIAIAHLLTIDGLNNPMFTDAFIYILSMGGTYILGAILYGSRFPEKLWPGRFDYVFASHQWFHVCIVIAAFFHYVGSYQLFSYARNLTCPV